jgi:hypothetical protein
MRKSLGVTLAGLAILACLAVAGCTKSHPAAQARASAAASAIQNNPATTAAEAKVQTCVGTELVRGYNAVITCIAPPGTGASVKACVGLKLQADGLTTKADRLKFYQDAANCAVSPSPSPSVSNG